MNKFLTAKSVAIALVVSLLLGVIGALTLGWYLWGKNKGTTIQQTAEPEQRNPDDSLRLKKVPTETPQPKQTLPANAKVTSTIHTVVRPHGQPAGATTTTPGSNATGLPQMPSSGPSDLGIDITLYDTPDGQTHAVASSPDGTIISGEYDPIVKRIKFSEKKNAAGVIGGVTTAPARIVGVWYDRDMAWARVGGIATYTKYLHSQKADYGLLLKAGIRW